MKVKKYSSGQLCLIIAVLIVGQILMGAALARLANHNSTQPVSDKHGKTPNEKPVNRPQ
jgi:hypothetical protein